MNRKIRVGFIIGQLAYGGAERQLSMLVSALSRSQLVTPLVFCTSNNIHPFSSRIIESGVSLFVYEKNCGSYLQKILWVIKKIKSSKVDIIVGFLNTGNIYAAFCSLLFRLPYIATIRSADKTLGCVIKRLSSFSCNNANYIIANSRSCIEIALDELKIKNKKIGIIENGVEIPAGIDNNLDKSDNYSNLSSKWIIGTLANIKVAKRPNFFIDVYLELAKIRIKDFSFVWIGEGPERNSIEERLKSLPVEYLDSITFLGATENTNHLLAKLDVFILTSAFEGLPNSLLEAMAIGLPCLATNVPGTRDVCSQNEPEVILTDSDSPSDMARAISILLDDEKLRQKMGMRAKKLVEEKYSVEKMVNDYERIIVKTANIHE